MFTQSSGFSVIAALRSLESDNMVSYNVLFVSDLHVHAESWLLCCYYCFSSITPRVSGKWQHDKLEYQYVFLTGFLATAAPVPPHARISEKWQHGKLECFMRILTYMDVNVHTESWFLHYCCSNIIVRMASTR